MEKETFNLNITRDEFNSLVVLSIISIFIVEVILIILKIIFLFSAISLFNHLVLNHQSFFSAPTLARLFPFTSLILFLNYTLQHIVFENKTHKYKIIKGITPFVKSAFSEFESHTNKRLQKDK